eukprot:1158796-Pelagomonas_calceolata.AAC.9
MLQKGAQSMQECTVWLLWVNSSTAFLSHEECEGDASRSLEWNFIFVALDAERFGRQCFPIIFMLL